MVDRRKDPNYKQVAGYVAADIASRFKVCCYLGQVVQSVALEEAIDLYLQKYEQKAEQKADPKPEQVDFQTFADLVKANYFALGESGKIPLSRLKELVLGQKPTAAELSLIANVLEIEEEEVVRLRDCAFPPTGSKKQKPRETNGVN